MTTTPEAYMLKATLLERITEAHQDMEQLLARLDEMQMSQPHIYPNLTVKDILAHITAWMELEIGWIETSLRGEKVVRFVPGYEIEGGNWEEVTHRLNEHLYQTHKDKPLDDALADFRTTHQRLVALVQSLSEQDLNDPTRFDWWSNRPVWQIIAANSYMHYREHQESIQVWLKHQ